MHFQDIMQPRGMKFCSYVKKLGLPK